MYTKEFPGKVVGPLGGVGWSVCKRPRGKPENLRKRATDKYSQGGALRIAHKRAPSSYSLRVP
jgi:hypothetical protein